jgi:hypothetical protein
VVVGPVGLWATRRVVHKSTGGCRSGSRSQPDVIAQISVRVVIGEAMGTVKDRQPAVRVFVHAHRGAHKMRAQRAGRDLIAQLQVGMADNG